MNDTISTGKIPENSQLCLMFSLDIFLVEMMSFMFLSQHKHSSNFLIVKINTVLNLNPSCFKIFIISSQDTKIDSYYPNLKSSIL